MAVNMLAGKQTFVTSAGVPLVGGKLYTYDAGTSTPRQTFSDAAGTTPNANPVILDARGEAVLFWLGTYKVVLRDAADVIIWTMDNQSGTDVALAGIAALTADLANSAASAKGAGQVGFSSALAYATGTVGNKLLQRIDIRDYGSSLVTAIASIGATPTELVIASAVTMGASSTIPATMSLAFERGGIVTTTGWTLTINGKMNPTWSQCFAGTGSVVFVVGSIPYITAEMWGAVANAAANGASGTDSTTAIQAALNVPTIPVHLGYGNYLFSNLTMPNEKGFFGESIHSSNLISKLGSVGTMFTDQGSAAKIDIAGIAFYGNNCAYTKGFVLGETGAFGTEGSVSVWVRDLPAGFAGIRLVGNVAYIDKLFAQSTGGVDVVGYGNHVGSLQSYGSKGFTIAAVQVATNLQLTRVDSLEIEATSTGVIPLYLTGNASIGALFLAPTVALTYPHLVEIGPSCAQWEFTTIFPSASGYTVTNGNYKSGSYYFGGNAGTSVASGDGRFANTDRFLGVTGYAGAAPTIASAATIAPSRPATFISGAVAIATISVPYPIGNTGGSLTLIPTGAFTWTAAGNIAVAGTAVVNRALICTYDSATTKWYPSYV